MGQVGVGGGDEQQARLSLVHLPGEVGRDLQCGQDHHEFRLIIKSGCNGYISPPVNIHLRRSGEAHKGL